MKIQQSHMRKQFTPDALGTLIDLKPGLVLAFGGVRFFEDGRLGVQLKRLFPDAIVIGCSSAGEIANDSLVYDDTLVVTALAAEGSRFSFAAAPIATAAQSREAGEKLAAGLAAGALKSVFVLAPGLNVNGSALAEGLAAKLDSSVIVTGGLAGDGGKFQKTYTLCNETVSDTMAVAVGTSGDALSVGYGSQGGWQAFGLERRVTRADSNVLYELDGKPALQLYMEYLGDKAKDLPASGLLFPFSVVRDNDALIRTILNVDEQAGSLILAGDIAEGSIVRLMHAKSGGLVQGAAQAADAAADGAVPGADSLGILISCVGRKLVLGPDIDEEVDKVRQTFGPRSVLTGFYSYGEICALNRDDKTPFLHNQTMTITRLSRAT